MSSDFDLMDVVKQTAFNIAGLSEQMGIMKSAVDNLKIGHTRLEDRVSNNELEFHQFKEMYKQNERVGAEEVQEYHDGVSLRVSEILREKDRFDLFGSFCRQCWRNAKRYSRLRGKGGVDTKKMYHKEVVSYIGTWIPYGYGVEGYIEHLDKQKGMS